MLIFTISSSSNISQAQNDYRNLILSDQYNEHYLTPYLSKYVLQDDINDVRDLISNPNLQTEIASITSSILLFKLEDKQSWFTFNVSNRSNKESWNIDFGTSFKGRFGFFKDIKVYSYNKKNQELKSYDLNENQHVNLNIPQQEKIQIILHFKKSNSFPITAPLSLISDTGLMNNNTNNAFFLSLILLSGMAFFFAAVAIIKFNNGYFLFSCYYMLFAFLLFIQNNMTAFNISFVDSNVQLYILFAISLISLAIANFFWHGANHVFWRKAAFLIPAGLVSISLIASHFIPDHVHLVPLFLGFGASLLIFIIIPLVFILQGPDKADGSTSFMMGWFILLFGICISILTLSGVLQPVSTAINAYWIALIPQAFFFILTARTDLTIQEERIPQSKTLEINETDTILKLRQSKENTEQKRLLKVIEEERKVLSELRKSEERRTDEMRKAKDSADEANKGKSAFLAVISHEIRTPMTGIMGMVRLLLNSNLTKDQNEYANTIQDSSDAILALLNDILDYEKIEQGKMTLENIGFDLHRLIKGVVTLMNGHALQKNINLKLKTGKDIPNFVIGDPTRLRQVLLNLTGNAIKFTEKGDVTLTVELMKYNEADNSNEIYFAVTDNGIGISEEAKENLFTPFTQANNTISRKFGGTGLGLAISNGLISSMGSDINISSIENEGSTFFFTLNMVSERKEKVQPKIQPPLTTPQNKLEEKTILLIEDNKINRKVIKSILIDLPYTLHEEDNAEDGIKRLENEKFDLLLIDIELSGMNGDEATRKIRASQKDRIKNIPIIAITGNIKDEQIAHYRSCGISKTVAKPIDPDTLIQAIQNVKNKNATPTVNTKPVATHLAVKNQPNITIEKKPKKPVQTPPAFSNKLSTNTLPPITPIKQPLKNDNGSESLTNKNESTILNMETLDGLKKHLSDDKIKEMINDVLDKTEEIIIDIKEAINTKNTKLINARCHDLKGMTGNFGLQEISDLAKDLEQKSKSQPDIILMTLVNSLSEAKKRAETALSDLFS